MDTPLSLRLGFMNQLKLKTTCEQACVLPASETGPKGAHSGSCGGEPLVSQSWEVWDERSADCRRLQHEKESSRQFRPILTPTNTFTTVHCRAVHRDSQYGQAILSVMIRPSKNILYPFIFSVWRHNSSSLCQPSGWCFTCVNSIIAVGYIQYYIVT